MHIIFSQAVLDQDILIQVEDRNLFCPQYIQDHVDELRKQKVVEAESSGQQIRDALSYCYLGYAYDEDKLMLRVGYTAFRNIAMRNFLSDAMRSELVDLGFASCSVSALVETSDGYFVFAQKNTNVISDLSNKATVFGGILQPGDRHLATGCDVFAHLGQELYEEVGIFKADIGESHFLGMLSTKQYNCEIVYRVRLSIDYATVGERFQSYNDGEMKQLIQVSSNNIVSYLEQCGIDTTTGEYSSNMGMYRDLLIKYSG